MNVIVQLEYELAYYNSIVHRFNHYTMRTPPSILDLYSQKNINNYYMYLFLTSN